MNNGELKKIFEEQEKKALSERAFLSTQSRGRKKEEESNSFNRTAFMKDRDRIVHSAAFRRLKHKAQVFILSANDMIRTRLTHTLEVSQISRTIARALGLNEDLTEAIALGHDLGHTPFGHAGERALSQVYSRGFRHNLHSLRVVDFLEKNGKGLNLSYEVRDGILKHSKWGKSLLSKSKRFFPVTLEGEIVRICDRVAYINHDLDDALRCEIIKQEDIPILVLKELGESHGDRINKIVMDIVNQSWDKDSIIMSNAISKAIENCREFLGAKVYFHKATVEEAEKASKVIGDLYHFYVTNPDKLKRKVSDIAYPKGVTIKRMAVDYISMMTDQYALKEYKKQLLPKKWFRFRDHY